MRPLSGKALFCDKFPYLRSKALKVAIVTRVLQVVAQSILAKARSNRNIGFIEAQWWDEKSTLVVVPCRHHGDLTRLRFVGFSLQRQLGRYRR